MINENQINENQTQEQETEEAEPEVMTLDNEISEEQAELISFYRFIHENDLREEALALLQGTKAPTKKKSAAYALSPNGNELLAPTEAPKAVSGQPDLKAIRKGLKWNQAKMAKALNVSQGLISLMETGKIPMSDEVKEALAKLA